MSMELVQGWLLIAAAAVTIIWTGGKIVGAVTSQLRDRDGRRVVLIVIATLSLISGIVMNALFDGAVIGSLLTLGGGVIMLICFGTEKSKLTRNSIMIDCALPLIIICISILLITVDEMARVLADLLQQSGTH